MPGTGVFQRTFSDVFTSHFVGPVVGLTPEAPGPRNCGQFSAAGCVVCARSAAVQSIAVKNAPATVRSRDLVAWASRPSSPAEPLRGSARAGRPSHGMSRRIDILCNESLPREIEPPLPYDGSAMLHIPVLRHDAPY